MGIHIIVGNQGAGKSCYGVIQALKHIKKGRPVFSNLPLKNAFEFAKEDIMQYDFGKDAVLIFDEGATYGLGSRGNQYKKNTTDGIVEFFTMHRHYDVREVIIISPNFTDIIPAVRDNATKITVVKRGFLSLFGLISKKEIIRGYDIDEKSNEIKYAYKWKPFSLWWFRPKKAYAHFDSWVRKDLKSKEWKKYSELECDFGGGNSIFIKIREKIKQFFISVKEDEKIPTIEEIEKIQNMDKKEIIKELQSDFTE